MLAPTSKLLPILLVLALRTAAIPALTRHTARQDIAAFDDIPLSSIPAPCQVICTPLGGCGAGVADCCEGVNPSINLQCANCLVGIGLIAQTDAQNDYNAYASNCQSLGFSVPNVVVVADTGAGNDTDSGTGTDTDSGSDTDTDGPSASTAPAPSSPSSPSTGGTAPASTTPGANKNSASSTSAAAAASSSAADKKGGARKTGSVSVGAMALAGLVLGAVL